MPYWIGGLDLPSSRKTIYRYSDQVESPAKLNSGGALKRITLPDRDQPSIQKKKKEGMNLALPLMRGRSMRLVVRNGGNTQTLFHSRNEWGKDPPTGPRAAKKTDRITWRMSQGLFLHAELQNISWGGVLLFNRAVVSVKATLIASMVVVVPD